MCPLSSLNIEAELSYAYLHAIAAHAGVSCEVAGRHDDDAGVDARLTASGPFSGDGYRCEVDIKVQLKATIKAPARVGDSLAYCLQGIKRYDELRSLNYSTPWVLVVLFLPAERDRWLTHSEDALSLRRCAYWVSLRGAPASKNRTSQTVYLPRSQRFDATSLTSLMSQLWNGNVPTYRGESV